MKKLHYLFALISVLIILNSCNDDDEYILKDVSLTLNITSPEGVTINEFKDVSIKFKEINSNIETEKKLTNNSLKIDLKQGSYEIVINGDITYTFDGSQLEGQVSAFVEQLSLTNDNETKEVQLSLKTSQKDLIFEEIFFTGTTTPEGASYFGDKYFKIYNNTDEVLYADGLAIAMSAFQTVDKQDYKPDIMSEAFTATAVIQIPGNGTDYPINPGEYIIVTDSAINHKEFNVNSIDLSNADFEIYYEDTDDVNNPEVTDVINLYDRLVIHDRGFNSFVIFRLPEGMTNEEYIRDYSYEYSYIINIPGYPPVPFVDPGIKVPNKWIIDAVNLSVEAEFQWLIMETSLDSGWTHCGTVMLDESRYGKSVKRKVIQTINGKRLLQDTNNSTNDFIPFSKPSLFN